MRYNQRMRRLVAVLILVGCDRSAPRNNPSSAPPASPQTTAAADPAIDAPGPSVAPGVAPAPPAPSTPPAAPPGPTPLVIPASLARAPAQIGRVFHTGLIVRQSTLTTWTLRRDGGQALLTIDEQVSATRMSEDLGPWSAPTTRTFLGAAKTERTKTTFTLSDGTETRTLVCSPSAVSAAGATAVRRPGRRKPGQEECGDQGTWAPARRHLVNVLRCRDAAEDDTDDGESGDPDLRFARAPGIEFLYVNDDCSMQGGGWRDIPKDGSVAPPRSSLP